MAASCKEILTRLETAQDERRQAAPADREHAAACAPCARALAQGRKLDALLRAELRVDDARVEALWRAVAPALDRRSLTLDRRSLALDRRSLALNRRTWRVPLAAAASLLLALGLLGWLLKGQPGGSPDPDPQPSFAAAVDPVSPGGAYRYRGADDPPGHWRPGGPQQLFRAGQELEATEQRPLRLSLGDGSTVFVSGGSVVRFESAMDGGTAPLRLVRGSVYLRAKPQATGLTVLTEQARVTVLGTRFLVVTDGRRTSTVVVEGRVSCVPPDGARLPALTAGMRRDLGGEQRGEEHTWTGVDLRAAIAWVPGGEADLPATGDQDHRAGPLAPGPAPDGPPAADTPPPFPGADQIPENWQQR